MSPQYPGPGSPTEVATAFASEASWADLREPSTPQDFFRAWLTLQCQLVPEVHGGLLLLGPAEQGPFSPAAVWPRVGSDMKPLAAAAERALRERRSRIVEPQAGETSGRVAIAHPIQLDGALVGVAVLDLSARAVVGLEHALRQLEWGASGVEAFLRRTAAHEESAGDESLERLVQLAVASLEKARFKDAATHLATEMASQLACDRVGVGILKRDRVQLQGISHSAQFGKRTNLTRALEAAMDEAVEQRRSLVYPGETTEGVVLRAHEALAREFGSQAVCTLLLAQQEQVVGAVVLERASERPFTDTEVALAEAAAALVGPVLELQRREDRWIFEKLAEALARPLQHLVGPYHVASKLTAALMVAVVGFFAVAQGEYRVGARTMLEAQELRAAVAPFDGYVALAEVRAGDLVKRGDLLARLDDRDLRIEWLRWDSEVRQLANQHRQALADHDAAEVRILAAGLDRARARMSLIEERLKRTELRAPFDGVVALGDLSQSLGAPVRRGDVLFEVAPLDAYRVVLEVDESEIRDVSVDQTGQLVLAGAPDAPLDFRVTSVTPVSTAREGRNFFRVEARLDETPDRLRPGMEGVGKIAVGERRLIWIYTHPAIDWLRLTLWRWLP